MSVTKRLDWTATSIVKFSNHNRLSKELFTKTRAHVSKPESAVYKKRAKRTVDSDQEETKPKAKRTRRDTSGLILSF